VDPFWTFIGSFDVKEKYIKRKSLVAMEISCMQSKWEKFKCNDTNNIALEEVHSFKGGNIRGGVGGGDWRFHAHCQPPLTTPL
jgi:hypothetical protein